MHFLRKFVQFKTLDPIVRELIIISVIANIGQIIFGTFINIYAYQIAGGWSWLLWGTLLMLTMTLIPFVIVGFLSRRHVLNMRPLFIAGIIIYGLSFLCMLPGTLWSLLVWYFVYGVANGLFYCAWNTYELKRISIAARGQYSGIWQAFYGLAKIIIPLLISLLFFLLKDVNMTPYIILLPLSAIVSFISLYRVRKLPDEYLPKLQTADMHYFFQRKHFRWIFNISMRGIYRMVALTLLIISFYILKTEINIWIYTSVIALFTLLALVYIWRQVQEHNRVMYLGLACISLTLMYIFYAYHITPLGFIIVSIWSVTLVPIHAIFDKVNYLRVLESLQSPTQNIFSPILGAEFLLYVTRALSILILLFFVWQSTETVMKYALLIPAIWISLLRCSLYMWERQNKLKN